MKLKVPEQHLDVGDVLGIAAAGRRGEPHRRDGARQVTGQLAQVGHARVGGQVRLGVEQLLERALGGAVAAQLDLRVGDLGQRGDETGHESLRLPPAPQLLGEVVSQPGERAGAQHGVDVAGVAPERGAEAASGAGVEARVAALACSLEIGLAESGVDAGARLGVARGALEDRDALGRGGGGRDLGARAGAVGSELEVAAAAEGEDQGEREPRRRRAGRGA